MNWKKTAILTLACLPVILTLLLPTPPGLGRDGQVMIGILLMAVVLWISEVIPLPATGLLIIILQPLLGVMKSGKVFSSFGNKAIFFLLGSLTLAAAIEKHGLHRRAALKALTYFEYGPRRFILGVMIVGAVLSFGIPEHAVAALLLPILMHILTSMELVPRESNFGILTMLALTYGTSIGSWGTLLGGARNPLTVGFLGETLGYNVTFLDWMKMSFPAVVLMVPLSWFILLKLFPPEVDHQDLKKTQDEMIEDSRKLGKMRREEKLTLAIYGFTILMWLTLSEVLGVAVIACFGASLLFPLGIVDWRDVEERVNWGLILLYGGAITMGVSIGKTGAGKWLAGGIVYLAGNNIYLGLIFILFIGFLLTSAMSNTAAVALLLPIGLALAGEISGLSPIAISFLIALSGGGAFMLVTASPSVTIAYSSGYFSPRDLLKCGGWLVLVTGVVLFVISITYWRFIGLW